MVGVEQNLYDEGPQSTLGFIGQWGWTFPVVRDDHNTHSIFNSYNTMRDNWVVVDQQGKIAYKSGDGYTGTSWSVHRDDLITTLERLGIVPVQPTSWSSIKALFR